MKAIRARVQQLSAKRKARAREGFKVAHDRYVMVGKGLRPSAPLELIQIDGTQMDVIVVSSTDRKPLGRPYLILAMDVYSRGVMGFSLSFNENASDSLAAALVQAFSPKEAWLKQHGAEMDWPISGIPKRIHVDHGSNFISEAFRSGCEKYDIELTYRDSANLTKQDTSNGSSEHYQNASRVCREQLFRMLLSEGVTTLQQELR